LSLLALVVVMLMTILYGAAGFRLARRDAGAAQALKRIKASRITSSPHRDIMETMQNRCRVSAP